MPWDLTIIANQKKCREEFMEDNKLFDSYIAYELLYETNMNKKYKDVEIFPKHWYRILDYQLKIDILLEALEKNVLIVDTNKYQGINQ